MPHHGGHHHGGHRGAHPRRGGRFHRRRYGPVSYPWWAWNYPTRVVVVADDLDDIDALLDADDEEDDEKD